MHGFESGESISCRRDASGESFRDRGVRFSLRVRFGGSAPSISMSSHRPSKSDNLHYLSPRHLWESTHTNASESCALHAEVSARHARRFARQEKLVRHLWCDTVDFNPALPSSKYQQHWITTIMSKSRHAYLVLITCGFRLFYHYIQPMTAAPTATHRRRPRTSTCATRSFSSTRTATRPPSIAIWCDASKWCWRMWRPAWTRCSARGRNRGSSSKTHQRPRPRRKSVPTCVHRRQLPIYHRRPNASPSRIIRTTRTQSVPPAWRGTRPIAFAS
jgi:hypothetical protein